MGLRSRLMMKNIHFERSYLSYRFQIKSLPSGLAHGIVYPEISLAKTDIEKRFLIFTDMVNETLDLFYRHLDKAIDIPVHPSWSKWLWDSFRNRDEWLTPLDTIIGDFKGYFIFFEHDTLEDLISQALKDKIPDIIECMEWKGGKNGKLVT